MIKKLYSAATGWAYKQPLEDIKQGLQDVDGTYDDVRGGLASFVQDVRAGGPGDEAAILDRANIAEAGGRKIYAGSVSLLRRAKAAIALTAVTTALAAGALGLYFSSGKPAPEKPAVVSEQQKYFNGQLIVTDEGEFYKLTVPAKYIGPGKDDVTALCDKSMLESYINQVKRLEQDDAQNKKIPNHWNNYRGRDLAVIVSQSPTLTNGDHKIIDRDDVKSMESYQGLQDFRGAQ